MSKKKQPTVQSLIVGLIVTLEKFICLFLFTGAIVLILYLTISRIPFVYDVVQHGREYMGSWNPAYNAQSLKIFKAYRNLFYALYLPYLLIAAVTSTIHLVSEKPRAMIKTSLRALGLLFFWTFSYAIAGILLDIMFLCLMINKAALQSQGL